MSGVIHLSSDKPAWLYAGWVFRQVLEDVASQHPNDSEMIEALRRAEACGWLFLDSLDDADLSARLTSAIKEVATGILSGKIRSGIEVQPYGDARTIQQYRETLPELLHVLSSQVAPMFSEDVMLGGLKAGPSWFVGDHLLRMDSGTNDPEDVARQIADRNDLRYERAEQNGKLGFRFWRIEQV